MKSKSCAFIASLVASTSVANGDIYISQYYEGVSNDKWIEIYNSGTSAIDLGAMGLRQGVWSNTGRGGWATNAAPGSSQALTGFIAAGGTLVIGNSGATAPTNARANFTNGGSTAFTGDDSLALYTGATFQTANVIDVIGLTANTLPDTSISRATSITTGTTSNYNATHWDLIGTGTAGSAGIGVNARIGVYKSGGITTNWDSNGTTAGSGGTGVWGSSSLVWSNRPDGISTVGDWISTTASSTLASDANAHFGGSAGIVTLQSSHVVGGLLFTADNYVLTRSGSESLTLSGLGNVEVFGASTDAAIAVPVLGNVGLTKLGAGTLVLDAANTYTGTTTVGVGTLTLASTGSITSNVTVASSASFVVNGTVTGNVTVNGSMSGDALVVGNVTVNGSLSPGNSPGLMLVSNLTLADGSSTTMEIAANDTHDEVEVSSALTYDGTLSIPIAGTHAAGESFDLFDFATQTGNFDAINLTGSYAGSLVYGGSGTWSALISGLTFTFTNSDGVLSLSAAAIPEPLTAVGVLLLSARLMGRRVREMV